MNVEDLRKKHIALLDETVEFYGEDIDRRSINVDDCQCYYTHPETGNHCAVGRCLSEESLTLIGDSGSYGTINRESVDQLFVQIDRETMFKKQYQCINEDFWAVLQILHDRPKFWKDGGLTAMGDEHYDYIRKWIDKYVN